jgi:hypothetical protein
MTSGGLVERKLSHKSVCVNQDFITLFLRFFILSLFFSRHYPYYCRVPATGPPRTPRGTRNTGLGITALRHSV